MNVNGNQTESDNQINLLVNSTDNMGSVWISDFTVDVLLLLISGKVLCLKAKTLLLFSIIFTMFKTAQSGSSR